VPSIHALCPYGGLESFYGVFTSGTFIQKIFSGTLVLFVISIFLQSYLEGAFAVLFVPLEQSRNSLFKKK